MNQISRKTAPAKRTWARPFPVSSRQVQNPLPWPEALPAHLASPNSNHCVISNHKRPQLKLVTKRMVAWTQAITPALNLLLKALPQEITPMLDQIYPKRQADGKTHPRRRIILHRYQACHNMQAIRWTNNTTRICRPMQAVAAAQHLESRNNTPCNPLHQK